MRDHAGGLPGVDADAPDLVLKRAARERVEGGKRLVHQQDLGLDGQRARYADTLLHAAGQLRRLLQFGTLEADQFDEAQRLRAHLVRTPVAPAR